MADAKREIDVLNDQANAAKLHALVEAQEQANKDIAQIADQVTASGQLDTQNLLQSTTTTIITSKAQAAGNTEAVITTGDEMRVAVKR
jgi:predicted transcriptional regulator